MQKRELGKTGLRPTIVGFGGFHLVEIPQEDATSLLNRYLDAGGNYIETAREYGNGLSELKVGNAVAERRNEFILASKCGARGREEALRSIDESLRHLKTDYLDILFMHHVQTCDEARTILEAEGALEAAAKAREDGKLRYIGISGHGQQDAMLYALSQFPFDVVMAGLNYLDRFNFPKTESVLLQECLNREIGVVGMKGLADGYLHRSVESAIRYALSLPIATLVLGINRRDYLERDLEIAFDFELITDDEQDKLFRNAPELNDYVCRMCKRCKDRDGFEPYLVFLLEGLYDRQMDDKRVPMTESYALQERLKFWFGQSDRAQEIYEILDAKVKPEKDYRSLNALCPYGIDIDRKLKICHCKLSKETLVF
jgi:predicted aldo/keto reductase-like oxidoreductase